MYRNNSRKSSTFVREKQFSSGTRVTANYRLYDPATKKVSISRDVIFRERIGKINKQSEDDESGDEVILPENKIAQAIKRRTTKKLKVA